MDQVSRRGESGQEPASGLFFAEVVIPNKKGLHARASAQFVRCASSFTATVRVTREGHTVGGTSIMGLMMLGAAMGDTIVIHVQSGSVSDPAVKAKVSSMLDRVATSPRTSTSPSR